MIDVALLKQALTILTTWYRFFWWNHTVQAHGILSEIPEARGIIQFGNFMWSSTQ